MMYWKWTRKMLFALVQINHAFVNVILHNLSLASLCDEVIVMGHGSVVEAINNYNSV